MHVRHLQLDGCNYFSTEGTSAGGSVINMMNRKLVHLFTTLTLAAVLTVSVGSEVHAARLSVFKRTATSSVSAPKPTAGPLAGEPDTGNQGPLPPKDGTYPTGGQLSAWAQRVSPVIRMWMRILRP